jgi:hypothetical protein
MAALTRHGAQRSQAASREIIGHAIPPTDGSDALI